MKASPNPSGHRGDQPAVDEPSETHPGTALLAAEISTADLETKHPDWYLWRSGGRSWMATRRKVLSVSELFPDLDNTLMEKTAEALAGKLAEQDRLAGGAA